MNYLLAEHGILPENACYILHMPGDQVFRRQLADMVVSRPDLFETYQSYHSSRAMATLLRRQWKLSFVAVERAGLVFAGVYSGGGAARTREEQIVDPNLQTLQTDFGAFEGAEEGRVFLELTRTDALADLIGRLVIRPRTGRTYVRKAETLAPRVEWISADNLFDGEPPPWREWTVSAAELRTLGPRKSQRLSEWRGVYLIVDQSDGARYVGSAYGAENLLGRWRQHVRGEGGIAVRLAERETRNFRFSILERVSPDMVAEDVVALEMTWMDRLHTRVYGLNT